MRIAPIGGKNHFGRRRRVQKKKKEQEPGGRVNYRGNQWASSLARGERGLRNTEKGQGGKRGVIWEDSKSEIAANKKDRKGRMKGEKQFVREKTHNMQPS